jgi:enolase
MNWSNKNAQSSKIKNIVAREILDSRGVPTLECDVILDSGSLGRAAVPSGASTGAFEACELRDGDEKRYKGKGVLRAKENILTKISPKLLGVDVSDQGAVDQIMLDLDGTENKTSLGANAILAVSLAAARAAAAEKHLPLYESLQSSSRRLPVPLMNVLNGGAHANNGLAVQEFMIVPLGAPTFSEALRWGSEVFSTLKSLLAKAKMSTAVGDEGGFAPQLKNNQEALNWLCDAIVKSGYEPGKDIALALDVAATEFFESKTYFWEGAKLDGAGLAEIYTQWIEKYPIVSIEDAFAEDDWASWTSFTKKFGQKLQLVGDDLFVTNPKRIALGKERLAANSLLVKVNQIGTLSEAKTAVQKAKENSWTTVMSHRSGETEDSLIADLAVAFDCQQIKTGSLSRGERTAKYNQLLRIEERLGSNAQYWGRKAFSAL